MEMTHSVGLVAGILFGLFALVVIIILLFKTASKGVKWFWRKNSQRMSLLPVIIYYLLFFEALLDSHGMFLSSIGSGILWLVVIPFFVWIECIFISAWVREENRKILEARLSDESDRERNRRSMKAVHEAWLKDPNDSDSMQIAADEGLVKPKSTPELSVEIYLANAARGLIKDEKIMSREEAEEFFGVNK